MKHDTRKFLESRGLFSHIAPFHEDEVAEIIAKLESPLTAPATEAGGLGAELIAWAATPDRFMTLSRSLNREYKMCLLCGEWTSPWEESMKHAPNCLHLRAVAALAHAAAPEPDTFRERVERLLVRWDKLSGGFVDDDNIALGTLKGTLMGCANDLRALIHPPAREGG